MKFSAAFTSFVFAATAYCAPLLTRETITALDVLQYALAAENVETAFYGNFAKFPAEVYEEAGYEPFVHDRYLQIIANEQAHVDLLTEVIKAAGATPKPACTYKFPFETLDEFVVASVPFENVGSAAYTGAASYMTDNPVYLAAAATILATESRHSAWVGTAMFKENGWGTPFENGLSFRKIWTIAAAFVESCPEDMSDIVGFNDRFPVLEADWTDAESTGKVKFTYEPAEGAVQDGQQLYVAFSQGGTIVSGVTAVFVPIDPETNEAEIPSGLKGMVFPIITTSNTSTDDEFVIAGPTPSRIPYRSDGTPLPAL